VSPLRDLLIAPADRAAPPAPRDAGRLGARTRSLGVLAPARELPAVALAVGLAIARERHAALVCLPTAPPPSLRVPARPAAARLAGSLRARELDAEARGPLAVVRLSDDPAELASEASRARAAAAALPTVLGVARRGQEIDALLREHDAILVALPANADPALAALALAGAAELAPTAAVPHALDPVQRALALAGAWSPRAIRRVVEGVAP
jgi:hypothetical protein